MGTTNQAFLHGGEITLPLYMAENIKWLSLGVKFITLKLIGGPCFTPFITGFLGPSCS